MGISKGYFLLFKKNYSALIFFFWSGCFLKVRPFRNIQVKNFAPLKYSNRQLNLEYLCIPNKCILHKFWQKFEIFWIFSIIWEVLLMIFITWLVVSSILKITYFNFFCTIQITKCFIMLKNDQEMAFTEYL